MITELEKRIKRYFFAQDKFLENGFSEYWLKEMKFNRNWITEHIEAHEREEGDQKQLKLFNRNGKTKKVEDLQ